MTLVNKKIVEAPNGERLLADITGQESIPLSGSLYSKLVTIRDWFLSGDINASTLQNLTKDDFKKTTVVIAGNTYTKIPSDYTLGKTYEENVRGADLGFGTIGGILTTYRPDYATDCIQTFLTDTGKIYTRYAHLPTEWEGWSLVYNSSNLPTESGQVKVDASDTLQYLEDKLGDGLTSGLDKKITLDFSKVLKNEGFNSSMLKIPVQFIKNKELDIRLPYTNYEGNPYGVGTPLLVTNVNGNIITVSNVPYVEYLFNDLQTINWWNMIAMNKHTGEADSILSFTNTGAYTSESAVTAATYGDATSTFTVLNGTVFTIGDTIALHSARNKYFKFYPDIVYNRLSGGKYAGVGGVRTKEDGTYLIVMNDIGDTSGSRCGVYSTNKLAKNYLNMTNTGLDTVFRSTLGGFDTSPWINVAGTPMYSNDLRLWMMVAWGFVGGVKTHKIAVFGKNFEYVKYYNLDIEYSKTRPSALATMMVGYSAMMFHNGSYYFVNTEQAASYKTPSERWVLNCYTSKSLQGKFRFHSTVTSGCDWRNDGIPSSSHNTNGWLFTYNGGLYYWSTVTGRAKLSGTKAKIETVIYFLNEQLNIWEMLPSTMILNPRYTLSTSPWGYGSSDSWAKDHIGSFGGAVFEEGKIKMFIGANNGTDTYQGGYAEIRLYDSSPDFTIFG